MPPLNLTSGMLCNRGHSMRNYDHLEQLYWIQTASFKSRKNARSWHLLWIPELWAESSRGGWMAFPTPSVQPGTPQGIWMAFPIPIVLHEASGWHSSLPVCSQGSCLCCPCNILLWSVSGPTDPTAPWGRRDPPLLPLCPSIWSCCSPHMPEVQQWLGISSAALYPWMQLNVHGRASPFHGITSCGPAV